MASVLRKTGCQEQALDAVGSRVDAEEAACPKLTGAVDADGAMGSEVGRVARGTAMGTC